MSHQSKTTKEEGIKKINSQNNCIHYTEIKITGLHYDNHGRRWVYFPKNRFYQSQKSQGNCKVVQHPSRYLERLVKKSAPRPPHVPICITLTSLHLKLYSCCNAGQESGPVFLPRKGIERGTNKILHLSQTGNRVVVLPLIS